MCNLKNNKVILVHYQGKGFNITAIQVMPQPLKAKKLKLTSSMKTYRRPRNQTQVSHTAGRFFTYL